MIRAGLLLVGSVLADTLGFTGEGGRKMLASGKNLHKSWQFLAGQFVPRIESH